MSGGSFSLHYLALQDRIVLTVGGEREGYGEVPPVALTRRMVKLLGVRLREFIEARTALPDNAPGEDSQSVFQFFHHAALESDTPRLASSHASEKLQQLDDSAQLATKVDLQFADRAIGLQFYAHSTYLVGLTLQWTKLHQFVYSLAEMARQADWDVDAVFAWCGAAPPAWNIGQARCM